jgi:hypothetical protein
VFTSFNSVSVQAEAFDPSWPLDFSIEPEDTKIANELVSDINPELTHIGLINCNNNTLSPQQCQQITESGGQLEMLVDGNHDGLFERWSIAVGKMQGGEYAKVLLVQDATSGRVLQTLLIESPMAGFSALYFQQGKVLWGMCLSCDVLADIVWGQEGYEVSWQPVLYASLRDEVLVDNR